MSRKPTSKRTRPEPKAVLRLPDLDQAKSAALNSLTSADAQRGYRRAIDEFVERYCSEPRLSAELLFSVIGFISKLATSLQGQSTCALQLSGRLAYEPADCGLLSPPKIDLAKPCPYLRGYDDLPGSSPICNMRAPRRRDSAYAGCNCIR